jgi:multiple sugar transport system permease protein
MNRPLRSFALWSGVILISVWVLVPIYLLAVSTFSGRAGVNAWPKQLFPATPTLEVIAFFFRVEGVWSATLNSLIVALLTMVFSILLGAPAGYALARYAFPGKDAYRLVILLTRAFPVAILALPLTVRFIQFGVYDTPLGIALVHTCLALPFAVLVTSSLFVGIPKELEEAAWTMGCTGFQAFMKVVLPIAAPGLAATAIFAFVISWNEVFAASVLSVQNRTLTAYLLSTLSESPLHFRFAGGLFLIVPAVLFIFAVRKYLFSMWGIANR